MQIAATLRSLIRWRQVAGVDCGSGCWEEEESNSLKETLLCSSPTALNKSKSGCAVGVVCLVSFRLVSPGRRRRHWTASVDYQHCHRDYNDWELQITPGIYSISNIYSSFAPPFPCRCIRRVLDESVSRFDTESSFSSSCRLSFGEKSLLIEWSETGNPELAQGGEDWLVQEEEERGGRRTVLIEAINRYKRRIDVISLGAEGDGWRRTWLMLLGISLSPDDKTLGTHVDNGRNHWP